MGQLNSGYRRPNFSGSKDFYPPSNSSLSPVPASQSKSKNKKRVVIVVILAILTAILILVAVTIGKSQNNKSEQDEEVKTHIDEYIGLVLYGGGSGLDEMIDADYYGQHGEYYMEEIFAQDEEEFIRLLSQADSIIEKVNLEGVENDRLFTGIKTTKEEIDFIIKHKDENYLNYDLPLRDLVENGKDHAINQISEEFYSDLLDSDSSIEEAYAKNCLKYLSDIIDITELYIKNGCIDMYGNTYEECMVDPQDIDTIKTIQSEIDIDNVNMNNYVKRLVNDIILQCIIMRGELTND